MKIALVHDYLIDYGGAELVLGKLHEMYPKAPIFVLVLDKKGMGKFWERFSDTTVVTSWFNLVPFASTLISPFRFLLPLIWGSFDFSDYDLVISSASWAVTKGFGKKGKTKEVCYCHTPPRYLYGLDTSRNWNNKWFSVFVSMYATVVNHFMRMYDFTQAQKVDVFVTNSGNTQRRIEKYYRRESVVIYPPVLTTNKKVLNGLDDIKREDFFVTGGRMVAAKNFDLIIRACAKAGVKLKIFGTGVLENELKQIAVNKDVEFSGRITDEEKWKLLATAKGFIVAQRDEDFGITPVEASSISCPVIAFRGGGYLEAVVEGKTGIFFDELSVDSLTDAIGKFEKVKFDKRTMIAHASKFSESNFEQKFRKVVESVVTKE